ncbi:hypothetical protein [Cellulomonas composti]|uniref:Secreted protein n=1 Tax=Cellulomonas composti TaxID=266130 RepID=A0A511J6T3_9CELL|nr:hypothetical protein [Cellulomonas composti]GEL93710.1 hypothetical protein CCO02nite_03680 [Cellulomonas composti]
MSAATPPATAPAATGGPLGGPATALMPAPTGTPAGTAARTREVLSPLRRTPGRMRLLGALAALAMLAIGVIGLTTGLAQARSLDSAVAGSAQLLGTQDVRNQLVSADAAATSAFLVGGLEPAASREAYERYVAAAASGLPFLAGDSARSDLFGDVSADLAVYTGLVEQARANNRQGFPVGTAYLEQASTELRSEMLPAMDEVASDEADLVEDDYAAIGATDAIVWVGLLAVVVLIVILVWFSRRTHRVLNAGLLVATVLAVVSVWLGAVSFAGVASKAIDVQSSSAATATATSRALADATDAKSMESFTLIKRGSGQAFEEEYQSDVSAARRQLVSVGNDEVLALLDAWDGAHAQIRAQDDSGDWDGAVALATSTDPGSSNALFEDLRVGAASSIADSAGTAGDDLRELRSTSTITGWALLVAGLVGAIASIRGVNARLREYR